MTTTPPRSDASPPQSLAPNDETTLDEATIEAALGSLEAPPTPLSTERSARQPVHTVYGGAHLFKAEAAAKLGRSALAALDTWAGDGFAFARAVGLEGHETLPADPAAAATLREQLAADPAAVRARHPAAWLAHTVDARVRAKLAREAVEDFRIDFEDGYGHRPDEEEDADAVRTARAVAKGMAAGSLPPFIGIRIKALDRATGRRGARTLDQFLTTLLHASGGRLPLGFVITLPKVTRRSEVKALVALLSTIEQQRSLAPGSLHIELMVETAASLIAADGAMALSSLVASGDGRVVGAHFGVYDYTAEMGLAAAEQRMDHATCDLARGIMQIALAGSGVHLSDGATNIMPVPSSPASDDGPGAADNSDAQRRAAVHAGWHLHFEHVRRSLGRGFYQGWDLHPAQLPSRYAAVFSFFLRELEPATRRLRAFVAQAARATLSGEVFDDAATGQGLLNVFLRGLACGAITEEELGATGLSLDELRSRSFHQILAGRSAPGGGPR